MSFVDRLRAAISDRAPAPVRVTPPPTPAQLIGARQGFTLMASDFAPGKQVPGVRSVLASYRVPKDTALIVPRNVPFRLYLPAVQEGAVEPSAATTFTVDVGTGLVESVRGEAYDVQALVSSDGGATLTEANVANVNFDANRVTIGKSNSVNYYKLRFLTGAGEVEISAQKPGGATTVAARLWNASLRRIHLTDQDDGETALMLSGSQPEIQLAPDWRLNILVNSPAVFEWDGAEFFIEAYTQRLRVQDMAALTAITEASLR